jgi:ketosteroid isomerase-like protein
MSQENVERARNVLATLGERDPSKLVALADPEVEWHSFFAMGEGDGTYRGYDGTRR